MKTERIENPLKPTQAEQPSTKENSTSLSFTDLVADAQKAVNESAIPESFKQCLTAEIAEVCKGYKFCSLDFHRIGGDQGNVVHWHIQPKVKLT